MIEFVKVVGDALFVFEALPESVRGYPRAQICTASLTPAVGIGKYCAIRPRATKQLTLCIGGLTLAHATVIPLIDEEVCDVMSWIAGALWPPDEITGITDAKARRAAWDAWEKEPRAES